MGLFIHRSLFLDLLMVGPPDFILWLVILMEMGLMIC